MYAKSPNPRTQRIDWLWKKTRNLPEDSNPILIHQTLAVTKATNYSLIDPFLNSNHNHLSNHNQR